MTVKPSDSEYDTVYCNHCAPYCQGHRRERRIGYYADIQRRVEELEAAFLAQKAEVEELRARLSTVNPLL